MTSKKIYLGIPLGIIRRFVEINKDYDDSFLQFFEIQDNFIFTDEDLKKMNAISNGVIIIDLEKLGGQNAN